MLLYLGLSDFHGHGRSAEGRVAGAHRLRHGATRYSEIRQLLVYLHPFNLNYILKF